MSIAFGAVAEATTIRLKSNHRTSEPQHGDHETLCQRLAVVWRHQASRQKGHIRVCDQPGADRQVHQPKRLLVIDVAVENDIDEFLDVTNDSMPSRQRTARIILRQMFPNSLAVKPDLLVDQTDCLFPPDQFGAVAQDLPSPEAE